MAHGALRPDGPQTWIKLFEKLGARFDKKTGIDVQHLWDMRNLIVHAQGVADVGYVKKYPTEHVKVGNHISVSNSQFKIWLGEVKKFVTSTEQFLSRYKT